MNLWSDESQSKGGSYSQHGACGYIAWIMHAQVHPGISYSAGPEESRRDNIPFRVGPGEGGCRTESRRSMSGREGSRCWLIDGRQVCIGNKGTGAFDQLLDKGVQQKGGGGAAGDVKGILPHIGIVINNTRYQQTGGYSHIHIVIGVGDEQPGFCLSGCSPGSQVFQCVIIESL